MMQRATLFLITIAFAVGFLSCDTNLDQVNPNQLTTESYYQNGQQLATAVGATYSNLQVTGMYKRRKFFVYDALSGVVAAGGGQTEQWIPSMINWNHDGGNSGINLHWTGLYQGIKRANLVIENAPNVEEGITDAERNQYLGEAHYLRALYYYKLVDLWGDVPLIKDVKSEPGGAPRAPASEVYSLIESDLQTAIDNLPSSYGSSDIGRATSTAAQALRGRLRLARGDNEGARSDFQSVIDNGEAPGGGDLTLVDNYFDNFKEETENNDESIFEVQFNEGTGGSAWSQQGGDGSNRTFRNQEYGFLQWRNVVASRSVLEEMGVNQFRSDSGPQTSATVSDLEDPRATNTFYFACDTYNEGNTVYTTASNDCGTGQNANDDRPSWKKYQVYYREARTGNAANSGINFRELRYAEVLLGLAEAQAKLGNVTTSGNASDPAVELMNQVRDRVDLEGYNDGAGTVGSQQEAMDALYHEFVLEFTGEPPLFHFLLRNPQYLEQLNPNAPESGVPSPYLQPIPIEEIENNPELGSGDQNPGY